MSVNTMTSKQHQAPEALLVASDRVRAPIHHQSAESDIRATALVPSMHLMSDDGQRLVDSGITTAAELLRVTRA